MSFLTPQKYLARPLVLMDRGNTGIVLTAVFSHCWNNVHSTALNPLQVDEAFYAISLSLNHLLSSVELCRCLV